MPYVKKPSDMLSPGGVCCGLGCMGDTKWPRSLNGFAAQWPLEIAHHTLRALSDSFLLGAVEKCGRLLVQAVESDTWVQIAVRPLASCRS